MGLLPRKLAMFLMLLFSLLLIVISYLSRWTLSLLGWNFETSANSFSILNYAEANFSDLHQAFTFKSGSRMKAANVPKSRQVSFCSVSLTCGTEESWNEGWGSFQNASCNPSSKFCSRQLDYFYPPSSTPYSSIDQVTGIERHVKWTGAPSFSSLLSSVLSSHLLPASQAISGHGCSTKPMFRNSPTAR